MPIVQVLLLLHQSVTVKVTVVLAQPKIIAGLTTSDFIWQLSVEPLSTKADVTLYWQLASKMTPTLGLQRATGGVMSDTVTVLQIVAVQPVPEIVVQTL